MLNYIKLISLRKKNSENVNIEPFCNMQSISIFYPILNIQTDNLLANKARLQADLERKLMHCMFFFYAIYVPKANHCNACLTTIIMI